MVEFVGENWQKKGKVGFLNIRSNSTWEPETTIFIMDVNTRYILRISRNKTQTLMFWAWTTCGCPSFSLFGRATLSLSDQKFMDSTSAIAMFPQYFYFVTDRHKKIDVLSYLSFQNSTRSGMKSKWIFEAYPSERKVSFHGRNSQVENFDRISRITCTAREV